jgi:hypothetical protein
VGAARFCPKKFLMTPFWNRTPNCFVVQSEHPASVCYTVCDNADRIKYSAMTGTEVFV